MKQTKLSNSSKLRDTGKLSIDAVIAITDLVEEIHSSLSLVKKKRNKRKKGGISGFVYWLIRLITKGVGFGIDRVLSKLEYQFSDKIEGDLLNSNVSNLAVLSALNGVLGDYLAEKNSSLAIPMQLHKEESELETAVLFIHGLCMNSTQWNYKNVDLRVELSSVFPTQIWNLDYNTGKHISENGQELSTLFENHCKDLKETFNLHVVAHSMGGLVIRSAVHYAGLLNHNWVNRLKKVVFLGTPHHGSPLEKAGNWFEHLLTQTEYTKAFAKLGTIRSSGITDLRYGNLTKEDWFNLDRFNRSHDPRTPIPLTTETQWFAVAGSLAKSEHQPIDLFPGDGLVAVNSALGISKNERHNLLFKPEHTFIARGVGHFELLCNEEVIDKVLNSFLSD